MNPVAAQLSQALASQARPQVLSLHDAEGRVCVVFSAHQIIQLGRVLGGWGAYFERGYVAIHWSHGFPTGSYTAI